MCLSSAFAQPLTYEVPELYQGFKREKGYACCIEKAVTMISKVSTEWLAPKRGCFATDDCLLLEDSSTVSRRDKDCLFRLPLRGRKTSGDDDGCCTPAVGCSSTSSGDGEPPLVHHSACPARKSVPIASLQKTNMFSVIKANDLLCLLNP